MNDSTCPPLRGLLPTRLAFGHRIDFLHHAFDTLRGRAHHPQESPAFARRTAIAVAERLAEAVM
jgi:hypothetical protein